MIRCPACGTLNRVPPEKLARGSLLVLRGGKEIDRIVGAQPKAEIARRLEQVT